VPAPCSAVYERYTADLDRSGLAASTRQHLARSVRRFLRWLPANVDDISTVLTQPEAWQHAASGFTGDLAAAAGPLSPDVQSHRNALADCARRIGLAEPYVSVPDRFRCVYDPYAAAATGSHLAAATRRSHLDAVRAFLRWLDRSGYCGDLRRDWGTAAARYLQHLSGKGNAPSTVLRQRAALNHCAACLRLPATTAADMRAQSLRVPDKPQLQGSQEIRQLPGDLTAPARSRPRR